MHLIPPHLLNAMGGDVHSSISRAISVMECQETTCAYNLVKFMNYNVLFL